MHYKPEWLATLRKGFLRVMGDQLVVDLTAIDHCPFCELRSLANLHDFVLMARYAFGVTHVVVLYNSGTHPHYQVAEIEADQVTNEPDSWPRLTGMAHDPCNVLPTIKGVGPTWEPKTLTS